MKDEINNIRSQFRSLKISLVDLYMKNKLRVKISLDIKDFIRRIDESVKILKRIFLLDLEKSLKDKKSTHS